MKCCVNNEILEGLHFETSVGLGDHEILRVSLVGVWCPVVWSNTILDTVVKVVGGCD